MKTENIRVYISGALTGIENSEVIKSFYEDIGSLCKNMGFESYVPHLNTDPINHPNIDPTKVFETDKHQVGMSNLVIAYLGFPSFGVGMELAYAENKGISVILLYETDKSISRFPRGIPTIFSEIKFHNYKDALSKLEKVLKEWKENYIKSSSVASSST
ncbi:MAG: XRE family transcriptional regulator [Cyanobacteria bacterium J06633_8]